MVMQRGALGEGHATCTITHWLIPTLAALVQIHTTLPLGSIGLRLSLGDLVLPVAVLACVVCLARRADLHAVIRHPPRALVLLALATLWLIVAIGHGRIEVGHWVGWALLNRGVGWAVLLAYFFCGWVAGITQPTAISDRVVGSLLFLFWISCLASALLYVALSHKWFGIAPVPEHLASSIEQTIGLVTGTSRFQGFVVNPNSFGFIAATAIALQIPYIRCDRLMSPRCHGWGLGISLFGLAWSFSRGAWAAAAAAFVLLALLRRIDYRLLGVSIVVAIGLSAALELVSATPRITAQMALYSEPAPTTGQFTSAASVAHRWLITERSLELWKEAPLLGAGVGVFVHRQAQIADASIATIHSTYLWLLAELGVVGLVFFSAFFLTSFFVLMQARFDADAGRFFTAIVALLIAFAAVALVMEALYQRHIWLLLGVALGLVEARRKPARERAESNPASEQASL